MRILLAAEGETDEIVAKRLLADVLLDAEIQPKRMPARGFSVLKRLLTDVVRAAHFGHFDLLVVHFDLDDTLLETHQHVHESQRWLEIRREVDEQLAKLGVSAGRTTPLHAVLMAPAQSTDAWLRWALMNGDGKKVEKLNRHTLKRIVFGDPPRRLLEKANAGAEGLLVQMANCEQWPRSLRDFRNELEAFQESRKLLT